MVGREIKRYSLSLATAWANPAVAHAETVTRDRHSWVNHCSYQHIVNTLPCQQSFFTSRGMVLAVEDMQLLLLLPGTKTSMMLNTNNTVLIIMLSAHVEQK